MKAKKKSFRTKARNTKFYKRNAKNYEHDVNFELDEIERRSIHFINAAIEEMESYLVNMEMENVDWQMQFDDIHISDDNIKIWEQKIQRVAKKEEKKITNALLLPKFDIIIPEDHIKKMRKFDVECGSITWNTCYNCKRSFPRLVVNDCNTCTLCVRNPERWTKKNDMDPGTVPAELSELTEIEAMVIAQVHPIISIFRHRQGQHLYRGNVINFPQNIDTFVNVLPHIPTSIPYIIVFHRKAQKCTFKCIARPEKLRAALLWLKKNNKWYKNIEISEKNLSQYPEDGDITELIKKTVLDTDEDNEEIIEEQLNSFIPNTPSLTEDEVIRQQLNLPYPEVENSPINEFKKNGYISKAFPVLFPHGTGDYSDYHADDDITFPEYCKFLMQYEDRRFAQDFRLRYFLFNTQIRHKLLSKANIYIKQGDWKNKNAEDFKEAVKKNPKIMDSLISFNKGIKSTVAFWKSKCGELINMCKQLGSPQIFFTLSAADYHWPDLFKLIAPNQNFEDLNEEMRKELMHKNPLITSYFFQYRMELFMKLILIPIFKVVDYCYRFEWQGRGSTHAHGMLWIDDAIIFDENNYTDTDIEDICKYFKSIVFAVTPMEKRSDTHPSQKKFSDILNEHQENDLIELITHVQLHTRCGNHCLRRNIVTQKIACRYNFPCNMRDEAEVNDEEGYLRFFPKRNHPLIQRYSPIILKSWRANHDFSPICSLQAVLHYIIKYMLKGETLTKTLQTLLNDSCTSAKKNDNLHPILSSLFIHTLGERDISAQEVCHLLMGWPLVKTSRTFITISLFDEKWDNIQVVGKKIKITKSTFIEKYQHRPMFCKGENIENITLLDFAKHYDVKDKKYFKHKISRIVQIAPVVKFIPHSKNNESYYRQQCLLNIPFRCDPNKLLKMNDKNKNSWKKLYEHSNLHKDDDELYENIDDDETEELPIIDDELRQTVAELNCAFTTKVNDETIGKRLMDLTYDWISASEEYPKIEKVMNFLENYKNIQINMPDKDKCNITFSKEQEKILITLEKQIMSIKCKQYDKNLPRQIIIQGKAGSGKSTIINAMVEKITEKFGTGSVKVCAPTGAAAINVDGNTMHSEFKLHIKAQNTQLLTGQKAKKFAAENKNLKFVIIDEMSMIGAVRLWQLHCRLQELNPRSKYPFGGIFIYFLGDFRQLPPVKDTALYYTNAKTPNGKKGLQLFKSITHRIELKCTFRQAKDKRFAQLVDRIGYGEITESDYKLLATRNIEVLSKSEIESFKNAVHLCSTNDHVSYANAKHLEKLGNPIAEIIAINKPNIQLKKSEEDAAGLSAKLYLSIGSRIMLTKNLWTKAGLVNGALGTVTAIVYDSKNLPPNLPLYILIKFDKYYGPCFYEESIPIIPENAYWTLDNIEYFRKQYPLTLTYANSIHKGQGLTIPKVIIDIGDYEFACGITYVAITRARKLTDIIFKPFFPIRRIKKIGSSQVMKARIKFMQSFNNN